MWEIEANFVQFSEEFGENYGGNTEFGESLVEFRKKEIGANEGSLLRPSHKIPSKMNSRNRTGEIGRTSQSGGTVRFLGIVRVH